MPELFRAFGFSFMFFSLEHEPIHVHVHGNDGDAKFCWDGKEFKCTERHQIKANDLKKIQKMIDDNADLIINYWRKYFNQKGGQE